MTDELPIRLKKQMTEEAALLISNLLKRESITLAVLAKRVGIKRPILYEIVMGDRYVTTDELKILTRYNNKIPR